MDHDSYRNARAVNIVDQVATVVRRTSEEVGRPFERDHNLPSCDRFLDMAVIIIGALLTGAGVMYRAGAVLRRGRLIRRLLLLGLIARRQISQPQVRHLKPSRRGLGFFDLSQNWPDLLMMGDKSRAAFVSDVHLGRLRRTCYHFILLGR